MPAVRSRGSAAVKEERRHDLRYDFHRNKNIYRPCTPDTNFTQYLCEQQVIGIIDLC